MADDVTRDALEAFWDDLRTEWRTEADYRDVHIRAYLEVSAADQAAHCLDYIRRTYGQR